MNQRRRFSYLVSASVVSIVVLSASSVFAQQPKQQAIPKAAPKMVTTPVFASPGSSGWSRQHLDYQLDTTNKIVTLIDNSDDYGVADFSLPAIKAKTKATVMVEIETGNSVTLLRVALDPKNEANCAFDTKSGEGATWGTPKTEGKAEVLNNRMKLFCSFETRVEAKKPLLRIFPAAGPTARSQAKETKGQIVIHSVGYQF